MSGGEEHSSLDSLRQNFCIEDLKKIEKQLLSWLKRQGPKGECIAQEIEQMPKPLSKSKTLEDYFAVYKIFFGNEIRPFSNTNEKMRKWACFSTIETLYGLYKYLSKTGKYKRSVKRLERILWGKDEDYTLSVLELKEKLDSEQFAVIEDFKSGHADFLKGKYYIESVPDFIKGYRYLLSARRKGYTKETHNYIESQKRLNNDMKRKYDQWRNIDVDYMKEYIEKCVNYHHLKWDKIDIIPMEKDMHNWTLEEKDLAKFIVICCSLRETTYLSNRTRYDMAEKEFTIKTDGDETIVEHDFYLQKYFILVLLGLYLSPSVRTLYQQRLEELSEHYYPAKYLVDKNECHPILDKVLFRELGTTGKIDILLLNLFEF